MLKTVVVVLTITIVLISCKQGNNPGVIDAVNQSLHRSNELITHNNNAIYKKLDDKSNVSMSMYKAAVWSPKAAKVKRLAATIYQYIDSLQQQLSGFKQGDHSRVKQLFDTEGYTLFEKLVTYKQSLLQVVDIEEFADNPAFQEHLKKEKKLFGKVLAAYFEMGTDSASTDLEDKNAWVNNYLSNNTPLLAQAMMATLKNDVLLTESMMIDYYNNQVSSSCWGGYFSFQAIALINSYQVSPGEPMEITAGQAYYSTNKINLRGRINNHDMKDTPEGIFIYKFNASGKPGTYYIPVTMEYKNIDGSTTTFTKQLEYTITQ